MRCNLLHLFYYVCSLVIASIHKCGCSRYALQSQILIHCWILFIIFLCYNLGMATMIHLFSTDVLWEFFPSLSPIGTPRPIVYYFMFCITTLHHHINVLTTPFFLITFCLWLQFNSGSSRYVLQSLIIYFTYISLYFTWFCCDMYFGHCWLLFSFFR